MTDDELPLSRPAVILLVDDDDNDVELTKVALRRTGYDIDLQRVANGEECLAFLRKQAPYDSAPVPDLLLVDLNMPRMDGIELMQELHADARLDHFVIVVLTSSAADEDVLRSYSLGCNSYLVKPVNFAAFTKMIQVLADYWFRFVTLPPPP